MHESQMEICYRQYYSCLTYLSAISTTPQSNGGSYAEHSWDIWCSPLVILINTWMYALKQCVHLQYLVKFYFKMETYIWKYLICIFVSIKINKWKYIIIWILMIIQFNRYFVPKKHDCKIIITYTIYTIQIIYSW